MHAFILGAALCVSIKRETWVLPFSGWLPTLGSSNLTNSASCETIEFHFYVLMIVHLSSLWTSQLALLPVWSGKRGGLKSWLDSIFTPLFFSLAHSTLSRSVLQKKINILLWLLQSLQTDTIRSLGRVGSSVDMGPYSWRMWSEVLEMAWG